MPAILHVCQPTDNGVVRPVRRRSVVATCATGMRQAIGVGDEAPGVVVRTGDAGALGSAAADRLLDRVREARGRRVGGLAEQNHDIRGCLDVLPSLGAEVDRAA